MKEKNIFSSEVHNHALCPLTSQCVVWLDEIDHLFWDGGTEDLTPPDRDTREPHYARELAEHARRCSSCTRALAEARKIRAQQRSSLRLLLAEGEEHVPSTTSHILAAIQNEACPVIPSPHTPLPIQDPPPLRTVPVGLQKPLRTRARLRGQPLFSSLVAAIIILASIATFSQFVLRRGAASSTSMAPAATGSNEAKVPVTQSPPATPLLRATTWDSVVLAQLSSDGKRKLIEQVDPADGQHVQLVPNCCSSDTVVDGVAHNGDDLLYHNAQNNQTLYHLLSGKTFLVNGKTGNAIWSTKDDRIFIGGTNQIIQITVGSDEEKIIRVIPNITKLEFFYGEAIYASREQNGLKDLYRIDLNTGKDVKLAEDVSSAYPVWIDLRSNAAETVSNPIFYVKYVNSIPSIYRNSQDDLKGQLWRLNAIPIGYGTSLLPIIVSQQQSGFQIVQMGNTVADDQPIRTIASGASALCNSATQQNSSPICYDSIAMNPVDGSRLVVGVTYPTGLYNLLSISLSDTNQPEQNLEIANTLNAQVQLVGWDKLQAPSS